MAVSRERAIEIYDYCMEHGYDKTCDYFGLAKSTVKTRVVEGRRFKNQENVVDPDKEIVEQNVVLAKQKQKAMDKNRIANKSFREYARIENAVAEYGKEILDVLKKNNEALRTQTEFHEYVNSNGSAIIQLSDLHLNELINLWYNKFDFKEASKRLEKFASVSIDYLNHINARDIFIIATGDILNSDRRLDETLQMATNRAKASILSAHLIKCFIMHINKHFNVKVVSVLGNESRIPDEMSFSDNVLSDNFDYVIFAMLKEIFRDAPGIEFGSIDKVEEVVKIGDKNILVRHGFGKSANKVEEEAAKTIGRLANQEKIIINYVIQGHLHSARGGDIVSRSSSLCGANAYSTNSLNLISRASQMLHIITKSSIDTIKIDLQDTTGYEGYEFPADLEAYNAKSESKTKQKTRIMEIII
jgi:hypothetical protein